MATMLFAIGLLTLAPVVAPEQQDPPVEPDGVRLLPALDGGGLVPVQVEFRKTGDRVVSLRWKPDGESLVEIPIVAPTTDCEVRPTSDGRRLVVLAGGRRDPLDLYIVQASGGGLVCVPTHGARLPSNFQGGRGSWPLLLGSSVFAFAYEAEGRLVYRAVDALGADLALKVCPTEAVGFRHEFSGNGRIQVHVQDEVGLESGRDRLLLEFDDPDAPRLQVSTRLLDFGVVDSGTFQEGRMERSLVLQNVGRRPLSVFLEKSEGPFLWMGEERLRLAAGEQVGVRVLLHGAGRVPSEGVLRGRFELVADGAVAGGVVLLQADLLPSPALTSPEPAPAGLPARKPEPARSVSAGEPSGAPRPGSPLEVEPGERELEHPPSPLPGARNAPHGAGPPPMPPPRLVLDGAVAHVSTAAATPFLLIAVSHGTPVQVWRGRTDRSGQGRIPLEGVAGLDRTMQFVVAIYAGDTVHTSDLVERSPGH